MKNIIQRQRKARIDVIAQQTPLETPNGGWIKCIRQTLGMTGLQLGSRMGISKASISLKEKAEREGAITLNALQQAASIMGCKLVYAIVPEHSIDAIIEKQAQFKAQSIVSTAATHMALEDQSLSQQQDIERVQTLQHDFIKNMPKELWDE